MSEDASVGRDSNKSIDALRDAIERGEPSRNANERIDALREISQRLAKFADERDWDQFHNPKNLAMALSGEAAEVLEHFQWLTPEQAANLPADVRDAVALECADVLMFLLRLCDKLGIDLAAATDKKMALNAEKYPVEKSRGISTKYDKL